MEKEPIYKIKKKKMTREGGEKDLEEVLMKKTFENSHRIFTGSSKSYARILQR